MFHRIVRRAARGRNADLVLIDVGPNLGTINRAAIVGADFVVFPLAPDLFWLQALRNVGPTLREWRSAWRDRLARRPSTDDLDLPAADITPAGYVVMQHYRSLMAMAHEARKPMFHLKAADGALGGHSYAVQDCYEDFETPAKAIAAKCDVPLGR